MRWKTVNYYDFINSKDVRAYLKDINYRLSSTEKAWIVFNSSKPLKEKLDAIKKLIQTEEDCLVSVNNHFVYSGNLHFIVEKTAEMWQKKIGDFCNSENAVYINGRRNAGDEWYSDDYEAAYTNYEKCIEHISLNKSENTCSKKKYLVQRLPINGFGYQMTAWLDNDLNITMLYGNSEYEKNICEIDIPAIFRYMDMDFPLPFKKGDVLKYYDFDFYRHVSCPIGFLRKEKGSRYKEFALCPTKVIPSTSFIGYFSSKFSERSVLDCRDSYMDLEFL